MSHTHASLQVAVFVVSVLAVVTSSFVLLTFATFSEMRKKRFMKFIFYISICDFCMGVISLFGFPPTGSALCWVQGCLAIYFSTCSWFWTTALSYVMYCIVLTGKSTVPDFLLHSICWLLPALLACIPLINVSYGNLSGSNVQWCLLVDNSRSPKGAALIWSYVAYFGWLFACCGLMIYWSIRVRIKMCNRSDTLSVIVRSTYDKVAWYPVAMIAFWILNYICIEFSSSALLSGLSMIFGVSYGTATAIIFLVKSEEAQRRWLDLIFTDTLGFRPSSSIMPVDFEEERWNEPFAVSSMFHNSNTDTNNSSNNSRLLSSKHASVESAHSIHSQVSMNSNRTGSSVFTLNSGFSKNSTNSTYSVDAHHL
jgi:hypothetical protein